jgi:hypothetical protein
MGAGKSKDLCTEDVHALHKQGRYIDLLEEPLVQIGFTRAKADALPVDKKSISGVGRDA